MNKNVNINDIKIISAQINNIINIYCKKSSLVRFALCLHNIRKEIKEKIKYFFRSLFHKRKEKGNKLEILVHIKGGIGDLAMTRIFIKKLRKTLPNSFITIAYDSENVYNLIFGDGSGLSDAFINRKKFFSEDYDIILTGCHILVYKKADTERIKQIAPNFIPVLKKGLEISKALKIIDDNTPYLDGYFAEFAIKNGYSRVSDLGLSTGIDVNQNDQAPLILNEEEKVRILNKFALNGKKYITIHNGISDFTNTEGYLTRSWPLKNWLHFIKVFKKKHPNINIVQIGGKKSVPFDFADICLVGKTELSELPYILKGAILHIDGESGMVHLANLTDTKCAVLYGPSRAEYLAYSKNINISSPKCGGCMNLSKNWMSSCILGYEENYGCMAAIKEENVLMAVNSYINNVK